MALRDDFELANQSARELEGTVPRAVAAHYDRKTGRIVIELSSKVTVSFSPRDAEGLEDSTPSQLAAIEISPSGFGIHFPAVDADLYVPGILEGFLGSKKWMASRLGRIGGQSRSKAKKAAARTNGKARGKAAKGPGTVIAASPVRAAHEPRIRAYSAPVRIVVNITRQTVMADINLTQGEPDELMAGKTCR